mmetsp:Transcript_11404/g.23378  ORF Transcript_11404/g.23378 Transcript_11404/m.23378 type:complete len:110 (+) Transcript_11404:1662-1991(+)
MSSLLTADVKSVPIAKSRKEGTHDIFVGKNKHHEEDDTNQQCRPKESIITTESQHSPVLLCFSFLVHGHIPSIALVVPWDATRQGCLLPYLNGFDNDDSSIFAIFGKKG